LIAFFGKDNLIPLRFNQISFKKEQSRLDKVKTNTAFWENFDVTN